MKNDLIFSIVIPVYNEQDSLLDLHKEILDVMISMGHSFEIIFINDGSTDETLKVLETLSPVKIINFRKNFGQTSALDAGIKMSAGRYLIAMDGDGQNNPIDIPILFEKLVSEDLDLVSGWRKNRKDKFSKRLSSRLIFRVRKLLINDGISDSGCTLKIYKRECFDGLNLYGEMHRFIPAILKIKGFQMGEIEVSHRPRLNGETKYTWRRGVKGFLDLFSVWFWYKFSQRPLHLFGGIGIFLMFSSFISAVFVFYLKFFKNQSLSDTVLTDLTFFAFFVGILLFVFGLMSDILARTYFNTAQKRPYSIKNVIENK